MACLPVTEKPTTHRTLAVAVAAGVLVLLVGASLWWRHGEGAAVVTTVSDVRSPQPSPIRMPVPRLETSPTPEKDASGYIVDEVGQAVAGATVSVLADDGARLQTSDASLDSGVFFLEMPTSDESEGPSRLRVRIEGPGIIAAEALLVANAVPHIMVSRLAQLSVRIRAATGTPAIGAKVRLLGGAGERGLDGVTNALGFATFTNLAPGTYHVWATKDASITPLETGQAHRDDEEHPPYELQLAPATRITGRVKSSTELGVASTIRLVPVGHEHAVLLAKSNARGRFEFTHVASGNWRVQVSAPGYSQVSEKRITAAGADNHLEVDVVDDASVGGLVVNEHGEPVAGARIRVTALGQSIGSDASQSFGTSSGLRWIHPLSGLRHLPLRDSRRFGARRDGVRPPECGSGHCGVDLGGVRGWPVLAASDGIVVVASDDDRGKTGRYVALEHAGEIKTFYMHLDSVAANIEVGTVVRAGTVLGTLGRSGVHHSEPHLHFALSRREAGQVFFVDPEPMLRFAVVLQEPPTLKGANLPALVLARRVPSTQETMHGESLRPESSDAAGHFHREGLRPGKYQVSVVHPEFAQGQSRAFVLHSGEGLENVRVVLRSGVRVQGQVVGPEGPVADAWVRAFEGVGETRRVVAQASVDADGGFALRPIAGPIELEAGAAGFGTVLSRLRNRQGQERTQLLRLLPFDSELRGQVKAPDGMPVAGTLVQILSGPGGRGRRTQVDDDGFFRIDGLPRGTYSVRIRSSNYPELKTNVASDGVPVIELPRGGGLRFVFRDSHNGEPVIGMRVNAKGPSGCMTTGLTDSMGQVALRPLLPGTWRIAADSLDHISFRESFKVAAGLVEQAPRQTVELGRGALLAGVLRDADGSRVAGARVWLGQTETRTDKDGKFQLLRVPTGHVVLRARQDNTEATVPMELFAGDEFVTLELSLDEQRADQDEKISQDS